MKNGYAFKSSSYCINGKYKIVTIANVQGNRFITLDNCKSISELPNDLRRHQILNKNDILISMTGNVGRVSLCTVGDFVLNQRVGLIVPKIQETEFLFQILSNKHFENAMIACSQGAAQMNIGKEDIESYVLPFSYNSNNLRKIGNTLSSYDNLIYTEIKLLNNFHIFKEYLLTIVR